MRAAAYWAAREVRRRLPTLLAIGLLIGVAGAATLTATAGARRTASTFTRHTEATNGADALVLTDFSPELWGPGVFDPIEQLDTVEEWTQIQQLALRPVGTEFFMLFTNIVWGATDERFGTDLQRFRILEGRSYDPDRADEVVLSDEYAKAAGLSLGDVVTFESWTPDALTESLENNYAQIDPDGPTMDATVVGIAREFQSLFPTDTPGAAYFPAAFTRRWAGEIGTASPLVLVRLDGGQSAYPAFDAGVAAAGKENDIPYISQPATATSAEVAGSIDAQVLALAVFAAVAGLAAVAVAFAVLVRQLSLLSEDMSVLRALGTGAPVRVASVTLVAIPTALAAAVSSVVLAIVASTFLPIGTPGRMEPDPGVSVDGLVLGLGAVAIATLVVLVAVIAGISLARPRATSSATVSPGPAATVARWAGSSPPISIGLRQALDRGRGPRALPIRSTLLGCIVGVAGATAALTFGASLHHLEATPGLYGNAAEVLVGTNGGRGEWRQLVDQLEAEPQVDEVATVISVDLVIDGQIAPGLLLDLRRGDPVDALVSGRGLQARDEVVLGRKLADDLGVGLGERVDVAMSDGSQAPYRVVGIAAHPSGTGASYQEQMALLGDSVEPFASDDGGLWYGVALTFAPGVDAHAEIDVLRAEAANVGTPVPPRAIVNLEEVDVFPAILAVVLAVLAVAALLHVLSVGATRRRHELAVLRALGFSAAQLRTVELTHAATTAVISLVVGVPLGVIAGRAAWGSLARSLGVVTVHPLPGLPILWLTGALALAALVGLVIARSTIRQPPAAMLRPTQE